MKLKILMKTKVLLRYIQMGLNLINMFSASVVSSADIYKVNLPDHSTIFTAEAVALKLAIQYIQRQVIPKSVIFNIIMSSGASS